MSEELRGFTALAEGAEPTNALRAWAGDMSPPALPIPLIVFIIPMEFIPPIVFIPPMLFKPETPPMEFILLILFQLVIDPVLFMLVIVLKTPPGEVRLPLIPIV